MADNDLQPADGEPTQTIVELSITSLLRAANPFFRELTPKNGNWTLEVSKRLSELADKLGYIQCGKGCAKQVMYDFLWLRRHPDNDAWIDVTLVAESEWGNQHCIREDFRKLMISRVAHRLMIFTDWKWPAPILGTSFYERMTSVSFAA